MDPLQFLLLAEAILRDVNYAHPAGWRTAVSRAYYAAHNFIKDFVESAGVHVKESGAAHADVWNHLSNSGDAEIEQVGSDLCDLQSDRNDADYRLAQREYQNQTTANARVAQARNLIETIRRCCADAKRSEQIKKAIQARHKVLRGTN